MAWRVYVKGSESTWFNLIELSDFRPDRAVASKATVCRGRKSSCFFTMTCLTPKRRENQVLIALDRNRAALRLRLKDRALQRRNQEAGELIAVILA